LDRAIEVLGLFQPQREETLLLGTTLIHEPDDCRCGLMAPQAAHRFGCLPTTTIVLELNSFGDFDEPCRGDALQRAGEHMFGFIICRHLPQCGKLSR
jgi:hypothetical protein